MEHALLKEKARLIVEHADDILLERIVGLVEENEENQDTGRLSEKDIKWLEDQSEQRRNGLLELSSWTDVRAKILANSKASAR